MNLQLWTGGIRTTLPPWIRGRTVVLAQRYLQLRRLHDADPNPSVTPATMWQHLESVAHYERAYEAAKGGAISAWDSPSAAPSRVCLSAERGQL